MDDPMIPELALGYARQGGFRAATSLANKATLRDTKNAWIVGDYGTGLIRGLTAKKVVEEFGGELAALNKGRRVSADDLGRGNWWKKSVKQAKSEPLAQIFGTSGFKGLDLGGRAFIVHRPVIPAKPSTPARARPATPPPPLEYELDLLFETDE